MVKRIILTLVLSVCVAFAGMPVQAMPNCPMMNGAMPSQTQDTSMAMPHDCPEMAKTKQKEEKKSNCCDNMTCGSLCSATISMNVLPALSSEIVHIKHEKRVFYVPNALTSNASNTQDKPPSILV